MRALFTDFFLPHLHMPGSVFLFNRFGVQLEKIAHCNIAAVQRLYSESNYKALVAFRQMGMKIVYDLDDDMWSVPVYNPAHTLFKKLLPGFNICASMADCITVSTEHLKVMVRKELGKKCPPVEVVENAIDFDWFRPVQAPYRKEKNGKVIVGWAGTNTHEGDVKKVFELIPELMLDLPQMEFELVGMEMPKSWEKVKDRVRVREFVPVAEFAANWASWQWDIALAPLERNKFNLSKSNIKMLEAAALHIPCVSSNVSSYAKFCHSNSLLRQTVMAECRADWEENIRSLVENEELRHRVGEEMYRVAFEQYNVEKRVDRWKEVFEGVVN
jgi:glycosyltransferase involved in cell wall biosynthesis